MQRKGAVLIGAVATCAVALAQPPVRRAESPAATAIPETEREQTYAAALVETGRTLFAAQCGFCHGLDAAGGSGGPDLTRSELVAADFRGDEIGPVIRDGRLEADVPMPPLPDISDNDLEAIVAFIHEQKSLAESQEGGRRAVTAEDVQSGDIAAGQRYFQENCTDCHSAGGDLDGIASRTDGLNLMRLMLNPRSGRGASERSTPRVFITQAGGESFAGLLEYEDEFTIALKESNGRYRSFSKRDIDYSIDDPLSRHIELLGEYTDNDMHDVLTYLHTLR